MRPSQGDRQRLQRVDVFELAKQHYTIVDLWQTFGFPGKPGTSCKSPFREEKNPSFSVFDGGKKWKDHATGDGGDVVEFLKFALHRDYSDVREWLVERLGIDVLDGQLASSASSEATTEVPMKKIQWPDKLVEGYEATWSAFAKQRGYTFGSVWTMVHLGILRFTKIEGKKCLVVLDHDHLAAEIRALDGTLFFGNLKAYPLAGVDKTWLVGASLLRKSEPDTSVLVCEGATDLLTAFDLYFRYRRNLKGTRPWVPIAVLGAACKKLAPECAKLITGRKVRIVPDADEAGRKMAKHWAPTFHQLGCQVETVRLEAGQDLTDAANFINPEELFT